MRSPAGKLASARTDLFAQWFSALEEEGECLRFRLGRCEDQNAFPEWHFLPHQACDGIGGLQRMLEELHGTKLDLPRLAGPYPSRIRRWFSALRFVFRRHGAPLCFRDFDHEWSADPERPKEPTAYAWALLGERHTRELREIARSQEISLNAWLLWTLTQALLPALSRDGGNLQWIVPINMRGTRPELPETANQASTLDVAFPPGATPEQVDRALREQRERLAHFGVWELLHLLSRFGAKTIRRVAHWDAQIRKHGSFSNLGNLRLAQPERDLRREFWLAFNPVLKSRPVGAACLTYQGRLALTLQLHPALSRDPATAHAWLLAWLEALLSPEQSLPQVNAR